MCLSVHLLSALALKAMALGMVVGCRFSYFEKCASGVRESAAFSIDEAQLALQIELFHGDVNQFASGQFTLYTDAWHECDSVPHSNKSLDRLQRGKLDRHVQGRFVTSKCLDDLVAIRRRHDVRDECLGAELTDAHLASRPASG